MTITGHDIEFPVLERLLRRRGGRKSPFPVQSLWSRVSGGKISTGAFIGGLILLGQREGLGETLSALSPPIRERVCSILYGTDLETIAVRPGAPDLEFLREFLAQNPVPYVVPPPSRERLGRWEREREELKVLRRRAVGETNSWIARWHREIRKEAAVFERKEGKLGPIGIAILLSIDNITEVAASISTQGMWKILSEAYMMVEYAWLGSGTLVADDAPEAVYLPRRARTSIRHFIRLEGGELYGAYCELGKLGQPHEGPDLQWTSTKDQIAHMDFVDGVLPRHNSDPLIS